MLEGTKARRIHMEYTPEKVESTLEFFYRQILEKDAHEIREEMREEQHPHSLLRIAAETVIRDRGKLPRKIEHLLQHLKIELSQKS